MPPCIQSDALAVVRGLREAGHLAYFAGGCVRDLLLGLDPKDWDIATDATPQRVRQIFPHTQAVGQAFGVILVRIGSSSVEVATFRSDAHYSDGRRPDAVQFTTPQQDAQRRDFTINGLFLDPVAAADSAAAQSFPGRIIDFVNGQADLRARLLRAIGPPDARFAEDHLRLLRAIRFAARFDLQIESQTAQAIRRHAPQLARISPDRVGEELRLILTPPTRLRAYQELRDTGLLEVLFRFIPPLPAIAGAAAPSVIFPALCPGQNVPLGLSLAAAVLDRAWTTWPDGEDFRILLNKPLEGVQPPEGAQPLCPKIVRALRQSLRLSNDDTELMSHSMENLAPLLADAQPRPALLKRFLAHPFAAASRDLLQALAPALDAHRVAWLQARLSELSATDFAPAPLLTGQDLIAAGLTPSPLFKRILSEVYDAQLEDQIHTPAEALALALRRSTNV